jgi:hypothetical protein
MIANFSEGKIDISQFDKNILKKYNLDFENLEKITKKLSSAYEQDTVGLKNLN